MLFSVLQLFISVLMEKWYTFKGQSLENGLACIFQAKAEKSWCSKRRISITSLLSSPSQNFGDL